MLFFFRGKYGAAIRAIVGAVLVVIGLVVHDGAVFIAIGAVLIVWGAVAAIGTERAQRRKRADDANGKS